MERFWSNSIFKYLRVEPEDHFFLLTEPVRLLTFLPLPRLLVVICGTRRLDYQLTCLSLALSLYSP